MDGSDGDCSRAFDSASLSINMAEAPPLVRNAANPKQVREAGRKVKDADAQFALDLMNVMDTPSGRRVVGWLLDFTGVDQRSYTGNSDTYFREGSRNVGLRLIAELKSQMPKLYLKMLEERLVLNVPPEEPETKENQDA